MAKTQKNAKTAAVKTKTKKKAKVKAKPPVTRAVQRLSPAPATATRGKLERVKMPSTAAKNARVESTDDANEGKYVYCIIKSERPLAFGALGMGSDPAHVQTVIYRDLAAVVSSTSLVVQDPTRDNVLAHQRVNETVMQQHTVIPMSFGTVFKTD
ncbi:MAG: GvpL/GvpF family gas vesicle protein, partial [Acidobacteriota bacterium]|nr:GvpL/GvpF family gas vesicle protein [Acidobacteriota bacterium]